MPRHYESWQMGIFGCTPHRSDRRFIYYELQGNPFHLIEIWIFAASRRILGRQCTTTHNAGARRHLICVVRLCRLFPTENGNHAVRTPFAPNIAFLDQQIEKRKRFAYDACKRTPFHSRYHARWRSVAKNVLEQTFGLSNGDPLINAKWSRSHW